VLGACGQTTTPPRENKNDARFRSCRGKVRRDCSILRQTTSPSKTTASSSKYNLRATLSRHRPRFFWWYKPDLPPRRNVGTDDTVGRSLPCRSMCRDTHRYALESSRCRAGLRSGYGNETRGQPPYNPPMMTKLLVYAYSVVVFSSRRIERRLVKTSRSGCWRPRTNPTSEPSRISGSGLSPQSNVHLRHSPLNPDTIRLRYRGEAPQTALS